MPATQVKVNPFPGLRPFNEDESHLFFGRDDQISELVDRLQQNRFIAVVGSSGSGKSSLVRAGLLPALYRGFMAQAGSSWRIAIFRPAKSPIANLATTLNQPNVLGSPIQDVQMQQLVTETTLRRSAFGLVEVMTHAQIPAHTNLLVVVDQFEELFRFKRRQQSLEADDEAAAFVKLLLTAAQDEVPVYVVLTMRSDFLGDCAQFRDLPGAINNSQYLIPRLKRDQRREAIEGPVAVGEGKITPRLVNQLLNDMEDDPDQLPVLQHALMRTWQAWAQDSESSSALDLKHYEAIGGMAQALSKHADEIYARLPNDRAREIAEILFKCLTEQGPDNRGIRHPTQLSDVSAIANAPVQDVAAVVNAFRGTGQSFIMPPEMDLTSETVLDISHESLMRVWQRLGDWVSEEAQAAQTYRRLTETVAMYDIGQTRLLQDPELTVALEWRDKIPKTEVWARRYQTGLVNVLRYLEESSIARDDELAKQENTRQQELERRLTEQKTAQNRKNKRFISIATLTLAILFFLIAIIVSYFGYLSERRRIITEFLRRSLELEVIPESKVSELDTWVRLLKVSRDVRKYSSAIIWDIKPNDYLSFSSSFAEFLYSPQLHEKNRLEDDHDNFLSVAFSPNSKFIATAISNENDHEQGFVQLWYSDGKKYKRLEGHSGRVNSVSFSPDGQIIASANLDNTVKLWSLDGTPIRTLKEHTSGVNSVSFSPDGQTIASASLDNTIKLWSLDGTLIRTLDKHTSSVNSVSFSPNGKILASASQDKTVNLWSIDGNLLTTLKGHKENINSVSFSPDGQTIASASLDNTVKLWNINGELLTTLIGHEGEVKSVSFSSDGKTIASASSDNTVKLWNIDGKLSTTLEGHEDGVNSVSFSLDGKTIASASNDKTVKLWSFYKSKPWVLKDHNDVIWNINFSPDGQQIASASADGTVKLWDLSSKKNPKTLENYKNDVTSVSFSTDGQKIASVSWDKTVKLWSPNGKSKILGTHNNDIASVTFSPDNKTVVSASWDSIKLWSVNSEKLPKTLKQDSGIGSVNFSPNGKVLAFAGANNTVKLWSIDYDLLESPELYDRSGYIDEKKLKITPLEDHSDSINSISFSPDGQTIASASNDKTVKLWSIDGELLQTLEGHDGQVLSISFSPDGKTLASAGEGKTIKLWNLDGELLANLETDEEIVYSVSFSPDGKNLAFAGNDITLWNLDLDDLIKQGCSLISDYLRNNPNVTDEDKKACSGIPEVSLD